MQGELYTLVEQFLLYLEAEKGYSRLTVTSYRADLRQFIGHVQAVAVSPTVPGITVSTVRSWVVAMHRRGLSPTTVGRHLAALRSFWRYLRQTDETDRDIMEHVSGPKRARSLPVYLGAEELRALLDAALRQRTALCAFRDHAIIATFVYAGLRRGEVLSLRVGDADLVDAALRVVSGKGGKTRIVPMVRELVEALSDWLEYRPRPSHDYLFTTVRGNRIYPSRLQIIWRGVLERSGIRRPAVTMHTLRHSFATLLLQSGAADIVAIQNLLGHSRLDTTAIYLHLGSEQTRKAVEAHPLAMRR